MAQSTVFSLGVMVVLLFLAPWLAHADSEVHLGPSYKVEAAPPQDSRLDTRYVTVERNGVRYRKFSGQGGDLFVLDGQQLTRASIESGQCYSPGDKFDDTVTIVKGEAKLSDSDARLFAGLIQDTTFSKCNNYQTAKVKLPSLDLGVSKTVTDEHGEKKEYRLFNTNLRPNLNFSGQF